MALLAYNSSTGEAVKGRTQVQGQHGQEQSPVCLRRTSLPLSTRIQLKQVSRSLYAKRTVMDYTAGLSEEKTVFTAYYMNLKTRRLSETDKEKGTEEQASLTKTKGLKRKKQSSP